MIFLKQFYLDKKGFTLIELIIAVSIFSLVILTTVSIINYMPKLAKKESGQFTERTYVRAALSDITATVQNSKTVAIGTEIEFTLPDNSSIKYEFSNGIVNKVVSSESGTSVYRLIESIADFSIIPESDNLFEVYIKTLGESKEYNFKVDRRRGDGVVTNAEISTIEPDRAVFDKNTASWHDVDIILELNGNSLLGLRNDSHLLISGDNYSIDGSTVTIAKEYLASLSNGKARIVFDVSTGIDPVLEIEIIDTRENIKITGYSYEDDIIRMEYPDNNTVSPVDNTWTLLITNGTVADDVSAEDLSITGLPQGLTASAAKQAGNRIMVTLTGRTVAPVSESMDVSIKVLASAVKEEGAIDSDNIGVIILSGASYASPEHNLVFTNELVINNSVYVKGDIVIGRNSDMAYIHNNSTIEGFVYVDSSITVSNNATFGSPSKKTKIFVDGSAIFRNNAVIYGDLYYRDTFEAGNNVNITGQALRRAVEIPDVNLPELMPDQWYIDKGYTVVPSSGAKVNLKDNGKYLFMGSYTFDNDITGLDNVIIVGKKNLTFKNRFSGSGIVFAPNGEIIFENKCDFIGSTVSRSTVLNNQTSLIFKRYTELPYEYAKEQ